DPSDLVARDVVAGLAGFSGRILQQPPAFSAVKVDGKRAYALARGGDLSRPAPREVEVYSASLLDFHPGTHAVARVEVRCGSGTYLRSIAPQPERSEEHTSELQSLRHLVCRLLLEKKKNNI